MTTEQIIDIVIGIFPSAMAILTALGVIIRVIREFRTLQKNVTDMKSVEELNDKLSHVLKENYELKKTLNELLTKIDHIERK